MSFIAAALIGGGAAIAGGMLASSGAKKAAATQANAAAESAALQKQMFDKQMELQNPFREAGITGQNRLMELLGLGGNTRAADYGQYAKDFGMQDFQQDPGYAFRLSEGLKGLDRQAAARGGLISGGALKAATQYGQEMGSQEYQNAFNRYQTNRTNRLQPLGNLQAVGQSAASNQGSAASSYGSAAGNTLMAGGQATAAGQMGSANTWANALNTGASAYNQQQNFNNWLGQSQLNAANMTSDPMGSFIAAKGW